MSDDNLPDPLSIPAIVKRMQQIETTLQGVPADILRTSEEVLRAQADLNRAKAKAALQAGEAYMKAKTVAEKDRLLFPHIETEWETLQRLQIALEYSRDLFRALDKEAMLLSSRLKAAQSADNMHTRYGQG